MAVPAYRHSARIRSSRFRARQESGEDCIQLDFAKDPAENVKEILINVARPHSVLKARKLGYLNVFVKLLRRVGNSRNLGFSKHEILCCLRICLLHEAKEVRAATLRVIRYLLQDSESLDVLFSFHIEYLIARSIDLCLDNELERIHALKLVRKVAHFGAEKFPTCLVYPLVAICNDGSAERDRMLRVCLCTLCELVFHNTELVAQCGGISTLLRVVLDCHQYPRVNEALVCTTLHLLNHPRSRHYIRFNTDLEQLLAPFTDCHYRYNPDGDQSVSEDREIRFAASKMAVVTIMRSWPGIIRFCRPDGSGLQSLIGILYLPNPEIHVSILMKLSKYLWRLKEENTDFDPSWKIIKKAKGYSPTSKRCDLCLWEKDNCDLRPLHVLVFLMYFSYPNQALVEILIIVMPTFHQTVILLGETVALESTLLPQECSHHSQSLPSLMAMATSHEATSTQRHRALEAVNCLSRFHTMKKRGLVPNSLYLQQLLNMAKSRREEDIKSVHIRKDQLAESCFAKAGTEDMAGQAARDSNVLTKEHNKWEWALISSILKLPDEKLNKFDEPILVRFIKRLVAFFKPTNHLFSRIESNCENGKKFAKEGCELMDFLVKCDQEDAQKLLSEWLTDIEECLSEVVTQKLAPESVLSPANILNTLSHYYFLFIGRLSSSSKGDLLLEKSGIYQQLLDIITVSPQDSYVKLIVSSLNYCRDGTARAVLTKALCAGSETVKLYSTEVLRVLLRTRMSSICGWTVELLVTQLYDHSPVVAMAALGVLDEACEEESNLQNLIKHRPSLLHFRDRGALQLCRFASLSKGFKFLVDVNYIGNILQNWHKSMNRKYVKIVEELLNEALTTYEKANDGSFTRRSNKTARKLDAFLPPHLYGQILQHREGFQLLRNQTYMEEYFDCVRCQELCTDDDITKLKTALWIVGHIGTSSWGISWLKEKQILPEIIRLAEECGVYSIRGTAFYVLGLLSSTREGAGWLIQYGWESRWQTRLERWPVIDDHGYFQTEGSETSSDVNFNIPGSADSEIKRFSFGGSTSSVPNSVEKSRENLCCPQSSNSKSRTVFTHTAKSSLFVGKNSDTFERSKTLPNEFMGDKHKKSSRSMFRSLSLDNHIKEVDGPFDVDNSTTASESILEKTPLTVHGESETSLCVINIVDADTNSQNKNLGKLPSQNISTDSKKSSALTSCGLSEQSSNTDSMWRKSPSFRESKGSSTDSSHGSKIRADSFNTDSTTSGVSSYDSGPSNNTIDICSLSPIASSTTVDTAGLNEDTKQPVHPSIVQRRMANLSRVPSVRKQHSNPAYGIIPSTPFPDGFSSESAIMYTTTRDTLGLAHLRTLRRQRTYSSDIESDYGLCNLYEDSKSLSRQSSIDSRKSMEYGQHLSLPRNTSMVSLHDFEQSRKAEPRTAIHQTKTHTGECEFVGLALPVDIYMLFEVHEGEDKRSHSESCVSEKSDSLFESSLIHSGSRTASMSGENVKEHDTSICLVCGRGLQSDTKITISVTEFSDAIPDIDAESEVLKRTSLGPDEDELLPGGLTEGRGQVSQGESFTEPSSVTSSTSTDSSTKKLNEDSVHGRKMIRREVLRLVINLSSSIGVKGAESGLLSLRQKFSRVFQDLCFYSEVCNLLTTCSFRLTARRFIQELFNELNTEKLQEQAKLVLGVKDLPETKHPFTMRQDSQESI
ncbi:hypothetical protein ScPMuIL_005462 [Solemya velum]